MRGSVIGAFSALAMMWAGSAALAQSGIPAACPECDAFDAVEPAPDAEIIENEIDAGAAQADPPSLDLDAGPADATAEDADLFARDSFKITPVICPLKGDVQYKPENMSCGLLEVPENREKKRGRKIELHFVKLHARKPDNWDAEEKGEWKKREDPIIYFTGGPGAKAINYVTRFQNHGVRDVRDLYILEQRGIGFSDDYCPLFNGRNPGADNVATRAEFEAAGLAAVENCFAKAKANGVDLSGYSTIENARDAEALRRALNYEQWNVWGISYGSILGQAYLKQDPEGVRAAVIDAIVPLYPGTTLHNTTKYYVRDLDILAEACDADETCAANFSDFRGRLKAGIESVSANPIEVDAIDTEDHPSGKAWFFANLIGGAPFALLYEQSNYASLPAFIDALMNAVERRDPDAFRVLSSGGSAIAGGSTGMFNAIACRDGWIEQSRAASLEDIAAYPTMSKALIGTLTSPPELIDEHLKICKRYGAEARPASDYLPVETEIRTLLVEGAMDPITPPPLAKEILPGFKNGTYVEFAFAGHGPSRSVECAGDFLTSFYDDPYGELDLSCPESMEAPDFMGPLFETTALARFGAQAAEDPKQLAAPGLWFGASAFFLIMGALIYNLAPVARLINGNRALPTGGARVLAWATSLAGAASVLGLAAAGYMTNEANAFLLLLGLVGWARWFVIAGLVAGLAGLLLIWLTIRARARERLPIGVLLGLLITGVSGVGLASFFAANGILPF